MNTEAEARGEPDASAPRQSAVDGAGPDHVHSAAGNYTLQAYGTACFLCHRAFSEEVVYTEEDVVPKWLLKYLDLGNASADLPNGQVFLYGRRKVPCCMDCNQRMGSDLEQPVRAAFLAGHAAVDALPRELLFLWLAKVYYGTRFRETDLRAEVADRESPKMLELEDLLSRTDYLRRCLLHSPDDLVYSARPGSIFLFKAGEPNVQRDRFDFFVPTMPGSDMIAIRVADTFVICIFGDNGYWARRLGDIRLVQAAMGELVLHPAQCVEIMLWFVAEIAGYDSSGCFDMVTGETPTGAPQTLFMPQFKVERNELDQGDLNVARVNTTLTRLGFLRNDDLLERARAGRFPTTLVNANTDELVQAECFELSCPDVFERAGWQQVGGMTCPNHCPHRPVVLAPRAEHPTAFFHQAIGNAT